MKKDILFVIDSLRVGGVQSALINLLWALDSDKYNISLLLFHYEKRDEYNLPQTLTILKMPFVIDSMNNTLESAKRQGVMSYLTKLLGAVSCRLFGSKIVYKFLFNLSSRIKKKYDVAISFTNNLNSRSTYFGCNQYVLNQIHAKQKISWLHVDYEAMNMDNTVNKDEYSRFDRIVHVSSACKKCFLKFNPELESKSIVAYNIVNPLFLKKKCSETNYNFRNERQINIITIARLDHNKNITSCLNIAKRLKESDISFTWRILGDGQERKSIEEKIIKNELSDCVKLLGYISNPYPFLKQSNLLVSTSLSESFGMVIYESTILGVPVLALNYPALKEIIKNGKNGFICQNENEIFDYIYKLANNENLYKKLLVNCKPLIDYNHILEMNNNAINF